MANLEQPDDAPAGKLRRTELQHRASSIPGGEILQALTEVPCGIGSDWPIHPGEEVGFIVAGTLQRGSRANPRAGEGFLISLCPPHNVLDIGLGLGQMLSTDVVESGKPLPPLLDVPRQWCGTCA